MITQNLISTIIGVILNLIDVLCVILPVLMAIAFMTIIDRKQLAAHQRRVGPNTVGYYGILQPFADALKLILKETVFPSQSNKVIFYLAPVSTLVFSLLGWGIIPFGQGLVLSDFSLGILYTSYKSVNLKCKELRAKVGNGSPLWLGQPIFPARSHLLSCL